MRNAHRQNRFDLAQVRKKVILTLLGVGLLSLALALLAFFGLFRLFQSASFPPGTGEIAPSTKWGLLEGLAGLATFCLVIGGLIFASIEYARRAIHDSQERAQLSFSIYKEMYDRLTDTEATAARRWILQNLPTLEDMDGDQDGWLARTQELLDQPPADSLEGRPIGRQHLKQILNCFDFIGFVANHYWAIENELVEWMNPVIAKVWERVHHVVEDEADRRGEPDYYQAARDLGDQCLRWRVERGWQSNIIEDAT